MQYYDRCWILSEPLNVPAKCFLSCNRAYSWQNSFRSPGVRQSTSYGCGLCIYVIVPMQYWVSVCLATSPGLNPPSIQFLFVSPHICRRLPSDSQSPTTPLPLANTSPCRVCRGLSPPSHQRGHHSQTGCACAQRAMPGAQRKSPWNVQPFQGLSRIQ